MKGRVLMYWCDLCGKSALAERRNPDDITTSMPIGWKQIGKEHICEPCVKQFEANKRIKVKKP